MKKYFLLLLLFMVPLHVEAKSGCCSWHGGVSYCGDNGRYVCNDGTYSPSCTCTPTITYRYGCTDSSAVNYDSSANKDDGSCIAKVLGCINKEAVNYNSNANTADGSCQFEITEIEQEEIPFETTTESGSKNEIKQEGEVGLREITKRVIKDENGNEISTVIVDSKIVRDPVNEIIIEKVETLEDESDSGSSIIGIGLIGAIVYAGFKIRKNNK